jgi:hypothetical protein
MDDDIPSGKTTVMDRRSYIKIETLRGITPTQIYESLREVCGDSTVGESSYRWTGAYLNKLLGAAAIWAWQCKLHV